MIGRSLLLLGGSSKRTDHRSRQAIETLTLFEVHPSSVLAVTEVVDQQLPREALEIGHF